MKVKPIEKSLPILGFNGDTVVSNNLDMGFGLKLELPEILSCSTEKLYSFHDTFQRVVNLLPENTLLHKQDFFFVKFFKSKAETEKKQSKASLNSSYMRHFQGRPFLKHECYLYISLLNVGLLKSYLGSSLIFSRKQQLQEARLNEKIGELKSNLISVFRQSGIKATTVSQEAILKKASHYWGG